MTDKQCTRCGEIKPLDDFPRHARTRDGRDSWCRDCNNRGRRPTRARMIRNRARQRATAELIALHRDEFNRLMERHVEYVSDELDIVRHEAAAQRDDDTETPRLKPGPRRQGEDVIDRLNDPRCPHCTKHHERGHSCANCGAAPLRELTIADDGDVDEIAIEEAMRGRMVRLTKPERREAIRRLNERGIPHREIATRLHINTKALERALTEMKTDTPLLEAS